MFVVSHGSSQGHCTASSVSSEVLQPSIRRGECSCTTACGLKLDCQATSVQLRFERSLPAAYGDNNVLSSPIDLSRSRHSLHP